MQLDLLNEMTWNLSRHALERACADSASGLARRSLPTWSQSHASISSSCLRALRCRTRRNQSLAGPGQGRAAQGFDYRGTFASGG